jgi:hypothetical protein
MRSRLDLTCRTKAYDSGHEVAYNTNVRLSRVIQRMTSEQQSAQTITLYKAPQKGKGQKLLTEGFQAVDFPYNPPYIDGNCYFAGPNDRSIAEEFNQSYSEGILEVVIDQLSYDQYFKQLEYRYDEKDACERIEVIIPQNLFPILNQFPRILKLK